MILNKDVLPVALTVAGSDSGGGAGIQADILTIAANGAFACSAIAALTAQNPDEVRAIEEVSPQFLSQQLETVYDYFKPAAAKTGMLFSAKLAEVVANFFQIHRDVKLVVDPVMISSSGHKLLEDDAVKIVREQLIPLAEVFTPNLDEAAFLLGVDKISSEQMQESAKLLRKKFGTNVLLKGGHLNSDEIVDVLAEENDVAVFKSSRIDGVNTHGSGCTLSAAIAARLARKDSLKSACQKARSYLENGMKNPIATSRESFINHTRNKKKCLNN